MRRLLATMLVMATVLGLTGKVFPAGGTLDPSGGEAGVGGSNPESRLSSGEFAALSDEQKREIYTLQPQRLPDGFNPMDYWGILHPDDGSSQQQQ